jgi:hypothetical protein
MNSAVINFDSEKFIVSQDCLSKNAKIGMFCLHMGVIQNNLAKKTKKGNLTKGFNKNKKT